MELHWDKGISLKQAWKIVLRENKFGDTVCPRGMEPNPNWTRGKGQKQCIKSCGFYEMRDQGSGRCKTMTMRGNLKPGYEYNPETGRQRKVCGAGQYRDSESAKCKSMTAGGNLKPGYEYNPETGRQRKMCGVGHYRDPLSGKCKMIEMSRPKMNRVNTNSPLSLQENDLRSLDDISLSVFGKRNYFGKRCCFGACGSCK